MKHNALLYHLSFWSSSPKTRKLVVCSPSEKSSTSTSSSDSAIFDFGCNRDWNEKFEREACPGEGGITKEIASLFLNSLAIKQPPNYWKLVKGQVHVFCRCENNFLYGCYRSSPPSHRQLWGNVQRLTLAIFVYFFLMVEDQASLDVIFCLFISVQSNVYKKFVLLSRRHACNALDTMPRMPRKHNSSTGEEFWYPANL